MDTPDDAPQIPVDPSDAALAVNPAEGINPQQPPPRADAVLGAAPFRDLPTEGSPPFINKRLAQAEFAAYCAGYQFGSIEPAKVCLHHTWRPRLEDWRGLATMRGMQAYYQGLGWTSGPHLYCAPDGIWLATPMARVGIHAGTGNGSVEAGWYSIGLEMVGDYDHARPSGPTWANTLAALVALGRRLGRTPAELLAFHNDYTSAKSCPGRAVTKEWVLQEWLRATGPSEPAPTHRARLWAPVFEAPPSATRRPRVAWEGQAVLAPGQAIPLSPTTIAGWLHWDPNGFVEAAAVEALSPTTTPARPVYTADSPLMNAAPWGDEARYVRACTRRCRAANTPYNDYDLGVIFGAYWRVARSVDADPWPLAAQVFKETGNLTAALSQRQDRDGRPLRNPAGIGVYERKELATPHHRPGTVYDADVRGYRPASQFADWVQESVPAHVGRYVAYAVLPDRRTPAQQALVDQGLAIAKRPLPSQCHGSARNLAELGSGPNPAKDCGWAGAGDGEGQSYGEGIATIINALLALAGE